MNHIIWWSYFDYTNSGLLLQKSSSLFCYDHSDSQLVNHNLWVTSLVGDGCPVISWAHFSETQFQKNVTAILSIIIADIKNDFIEIIDSMHCVLNKGQSQHLNTKKIKFLIFFKYALLEHDWLWDGLWQNFWRFFSSKRMEYRRCSFLRQF